jgi:hypothetical protein
LRVGLHPEGLAPHTVNLVEWRTHLLARLRRQVELTADPILAELLRELDAYPPSRPGPAPSAAAEAAALVALPIKLRTEAGILSLFGTVTVFGTPVDVTLSELALECFYPADAATAAWLRRAAAHVAALPAA